LSFERWVLATDVTSTIYFVPGHSVPVRQTLSLESEAEHAQANLAGAEHPRKGMQNLDKLTAAGLPVFDLNSEHLDHKDW
jgi:hypothetical protein